jgi:hypothetical protein
MRAPPWSKVTAGSAAGRAAWIEVDPGAWAADSIAGCLAGHQNSVLTAVGAFGRCIEDFGVAGAAERSDRPASLDGLGPAAGTALVDCGRLAAVAVPGAVRAVTTARPGPAADRADHLRAEIAGIAEVGRAAGRAFGDGPDPAAVTTPAARLTVPAVAVFADHLVGAVDRGR